MALGKGIGVWVSGFLVFLAGLNTFNAVMLWTSRGANATIEPYLVGYLLGEIQVKEYFWLSLSLTLGFLGLVSIIAYSGPTPYKAVLKMIAKVEEELVANRKKMDALRTGVFAKIEYDKMVREDLFNTVNANIEEKGNKMFSLIKRQSESIQKTRKEMFGLLKDQGKVIQKEAFSAFEMNFGSTRKEMLGLLEQQGRTMQRTMQKVNSLSKKGVVTAEKQRLELANIRERLDRLEKELTPPKPRLTSSNSTEEIKGIGPRFAEDLRSIGITNVGELVTADPVIVAERTRLSPEMTSQLQARAHLLMIPGIDEKDAELLEEAGISSRSQLARQEPIQLSRRLGLIAETNLQGSSFEGWKPTIEEVDSWIKQAKS